MLPAAFLYARLTQSGSLCSILLKANFAVSTHPKLGKQLSETERRLHTIISKAPVVLFALNKEGIFTLSEGLALQKLGLQPGEAVGRSVFEMYRDYPSILEHVRRALRGDEFSTIDELPKLGLTYEVHWTPLHDEHASLAGTIGVAVDVTERNRNLRQREQAEELYRTLVEQLAAVTYIAEPG